MMGRRARGSSLVYYTVRGGEEFIVLFPKTSRDNAAIVADKMRIAVEEHRKRISSTGEVLEPGEFVPVGRGKVLSFLSSGVKAQKVDSGEEGVTLEKGMPAITM